jgi:acid phosphatase
MKKRILILLSFILVVLIAFISYRMYKDRQFNMERHIQLPSSQKLVTTPTSKVIKRIPVNYDHIFIIVMENKSYNDIVASKEAPFLNSLIKKYSSAANYFGVTHPSLPNYLALTGGSTFNISTDCIKCYINSTNIIDQLEKAHKSWKAYMESMPSSCFVGNSGDYAQKHDPFIYFDNIRKNPSRCKYIVPFSQLTKDMESESTTPNFVWITPNMCHDMHDCPISSGDTWLSQEVPVLLASPAFTKQNSLLIITGDEGEEHSSNQLLTLFIGNTVKQGYKSERYYTHYSLLHTIENTWGIPSLTKNVADSAIIEDVFK